MPRVEAVSNAIPTSKNVETVSAPHLIVIEARTRMAAMGWAELWGRRELIFILVLRDIKLRYKQTMLGAAWSVMQPVMSVGVFSFFFGSLAKIPSDGRPYILFNFSGVVLWMYFSNALARSSNSLVSNSHLIGKIYFPRLLIPLSCVFPGLMDLAIALGILVAALAYYSVAPSLWLVLAMPLSVAGVGALALGIGLWLSAINARYRDVSNLLPFFLQIWMFCTPIVYPLSLVPENYRWILGLNPMVGWVEVFRRAWLGLPQDFALGAMSVGLTFLLLVSGTRYFLSVEREFADIV